MIEKEIHSEEHLDNKEAGEGHEQEYNDDDIQF